MADEEQLAMLTRSVEKWNAWRKANSRTTPQLTEADLAYADLQGADLSNAFAPRIILGAGKLRASDLSLTVMRYGNLREADFTGAEIVAADLVDTQCAGANFSATYLDGVDFDGADLSHAVFCDAKLIDVCFEKANLSDAVLLVSEPKSGRRRRVACVAERHPRQWTNASSARGAKADLVVAFEHQRGAQGNYGPAPT